MSKRLIFVFQCFMEPLKKVQVEGYLMFAEPQDLFGNLDELCYVSGALHTSTSVFSLCVCVCVCVSMYVSVCLCVCVCLFRRRCVDVCVCVYPCMGVLNLEFVSPLVIR